MKPRLEPVPVEEARRLGAEMGISEAQASRSAFRMLAHHPELARHVFGLLRQRTQCQQLFKEPAVLVEMIVMIGNWMLFSQLLKTLRIPIEEGAEPWPPDGKAPAAQ
jgi:hypothetical protein